MSIQNFILKQNKIVVKSNQYEKYGVSYDFEA
jgi:hypothetical protein